MQAVAHHHPASETHHHLVFFILFDMSPNRTSVPLPVAPGPTAFPAPIPNNLLRSSSPLDCSLHRTKTPPISSKTHKTIIAIDSLLNPDLLEITTAERRSIPVIILPLFDRGRIIL